MVTTCTNCGSDALTYELSEDSRIEGKCLVCGAKLQTEMDNLSVQNPLGAVTQNEPAVTARKASTGIATVSNTTSEPLDIVKAARSRMRELNAEIKRLTKLTHERDQLKRLLEAAKKPTGARGAVQLRRCGS